MTTCHEETTRRGEVQPCDKPAVAMRLDPRDGEPYPVCAHHTRGHGVLTLTELKARLTGRLVGEDPDYRQEPPNGTLPRMRPARHRTATTLRGLHGKEEDVSWLCQSCRQDCPPGDVVCTACGPGVDGKAAGQESFTGVIPDRISAMLGVQLKTAPGSAANAVPRAWTPHPVLRSL